MNEFVTKDLYLSSYLYCSGCKLTSHERVDGIAMFSFVRTADLENLVGKYFSAQASVNPLKYDEAMKVLRNLILGPKHKYENILPSRVTA